MRAGGRGDEHTVRGPWGACDRMSIGMHKCAGCKDAQDAEVEEDEYHDGLHCEQKVTTVGRAAFGHLCIIFSVFSLEKTSRKQHYLLVVEK